MRIMNNAEKFQAGVTFGCLPPVIQRKPTKPRWDATPLEVADDATACIPTPKLSEEKTNGV